MQHPLHGTFGCESIWALAWHISHCHWKLDSIPDGLVEDLSGYQKLGTEELLKLRKKFVHLEPASAVPEMAK